MVICIWFVLQILHRLVPIQDSYPYNNIYLVPYYLIKSPLLYDVLSSDTSHTSITKCIIFTECEVSTESMCSHPDPPWFGHIHWENLLATLLRQPKQAYNYTYLWYAVHMCTLQKQKYVFHT